MDQGFSEGFAPASAAKVASQAVRHVPHAATTAARGESASSAAAKTISTAQHNSRETVTAAAKAISTAQRTSKEAVGKSKDQARIEGLQSIKSWAMMPTMLEFANFAGAGLLGLVGLKKASSFVRTVVAAPVDALRATAIGDIFRLPANWLKAVSNHAGGVGERGQRLAKAAETKAASWEKAAINGEQWVAQKTASMGMTAAVGAEQASGGVLQGFMSGRATAAATRQTAHVEKAVAAATQEGVGFFARIRNFVTGTKPATVEAGVLAPAMQQMQAAMSGGNKAADLKTLVSSLEGQIKGNSFTGEVAHRANAVLKQATKAMKSAHLEEMFSKASQGGIKNALGTMVKAASRVSVFNALIGIGVTAGIGAAWAMASAESKESKAAFRELTNDIGTTGPLATAAKAAQKSKGRWGTVKAGVETVGNVADGMMWASPHGVGMAMMGAQMMPMFVEKLIPDNPMLSAITALRKQEAGELQLKPSDQMECYKHIIAELPSVRQHGGYYNRLNTQVAHALVEQKMPVKEALQLLNSEAKFTQFAAEVKAKNEAATGKETTITGKAEAANAPTVSGHAAAANEPTMTKAEAAYHAAEKPGKPASHHHVAGKVVEHELKRA